MPSVLILAPGVPHSIEGRNLLGDRLTLEITASPGNALAEAASRVYDLLVLVGLNVDEQQEIVHRLQQHRRWRLVPVLYVSPPGSHGLAVPAAYRPGMDSIVQGALGSPVVERRIHAMAREGIAEAEMVVAGPFELDPVRARLHLRDVEVALTERESEILTILLSHPNRTVSAEEIIGRGWGADPDERYLQILRRHVSNIRRKLVDTPASRAVRTVRGAGYRFDTRIAG
ncbi:MAG: winged-helix domain-containing protein [Dehalococcoidia bacterium]|nr:MAG: hypothetical protein EDM76_03245 [bacterium]MCK6566023.1 winged helix-turn-helix domain-containing protein [Dehalococcoidia bacterium]MCL4230597.1 winged helix-turn-helix domain-containing protein [Dehalococcoidia bacterium]NUQ55704.1 winged-helix domain-containing protein [Dehalococcoidia bacterium]